MDFWKTLLTGGGTLGLLKRLAALTSVALFAVFSLVLALFKPGGLSPWTLGILGVSALLAAVIAPYLLRTFEHMQEQVTRQNAELHSLRAIDAAIHAETRSEALLAVAVKQGTLAVDGEFGALWLFDPSAQVAIARAFYNVSPRQQALLELGPDALLRPGDSVGAPHRRRDLETLWARDTSLAAFNLRTLITVPLKWHDTVLGLMLIGNRGDALNPLQGFTVEDERRLTAIASTVSLAVQNVRLSAEARRRSEMLRDLVARTGEAIEASSDAPRLMQILADEAARIVGCVRAVVYAYDEARHEATLLAEAGGEPGHFPRGPLSLVPPERLETPIPYFSSVARALGLIGGPAAALADPGYALALRSRDQRTIGLLCLLDDAPRTLSPDTTEFARALASQAAIALENAHLAHRAQALLERTQALQAATNQTASERDVERVLQRVMSSARGVLSADGHALWDRDPETDAWTCRAASDRASCAAPEALLTRVFRSQAPAAAGTILALPLLSAGRQAGVLTLSYPSAEAVPEDEVSLAQSFAHQAANALENARLFTELQTLYRREKHIARTLQESLLPELPARAGAFEPAFMYRAALDGALIGGDFLDWFPLGETTVGIVMADVSGKGVKAAVQTAMIKYTLRGFASEYPGAPGTVLARVNDVLCSRLGNHDGFVTLFYGVLETSTGTLVYANAGHEPPLVRDGRTGAARTLEGGGLVLGCMPGSEYLEQTVTLAAEDLLLLYTDGLTEARSPEGEFLGLPGLIKFLPPPGAAAGFCVDTIFECVSGHAGDNLHDDTAMLLVRRLPLHLSPPLQVALK